MKAQELIKKMLESGMDEAASIIEKRIKNHPETTSIYISDYDDQAYNSGLADFLQNNTRWFNCPDRNGFKAIFN